MPGFPVGHQLLKLAQTHVRGVSHAIQPSHPLSPFSSCLQSFPASGSFLMSQLFASDGQSIYSQQKQDRELTVAQTMSSLLPNSDLKKVGKTTKPFRYGPNSNPL